MNLTSLIENFEPVSNPFGTHINLLRALGPGIKTVLELGAGEFSTSLFLDRTYYPDLVELLTVEQDRNWVVVNDDLRHKIAIVAEPIEPFLELIDLKHVDLIFVDNSTSGERRRDTLRWVAAHAMNSLVVAHDFDAYMDAASDFRGVFIDDRQRPWTALLWRTR